ncbi:MAG: TetR/AcrR family transcriptional regulator [Fibrobacteria bacterium]
MKTKSKPYHHGDLRNALLQAALELLAESGQENLSLREVALRAGVSSGAPYRHFENKEALLAALAEGGFRRLEGAMAEAILKHPRHPGRQLRAISQVYLGMAEENPPFFKVMFGPYDEEATHKDVMPVCEKVFWDLTGIFAKAMSDKHFRKQDPERSALSYWALLHGLSMLLIDRKLGGFQRPGHPLMGLLLETAERHAQGFLISV